MVGQVEATRLYNHINPLMDNKDYNSVYKILIKYYQKNRQYLVIIEDFAHKYYNDNNFSHAAILYQLCCEIYPVNLDHYSNLGACLHYINDVKSSEKILQYVLSIEPMHKHSIACYAMLLYQTDRKQEAIDFIESYAEQGFLPSHIAYYMGQITYHFIDKPTGEYWTKIALYSALKNHEYWNSLSTIQQRIRIWDTALTTCRNALALQHNYYDALLGIGIIYYWMGKTALSAKYFIKSTRMNPQQPRAYTFLGMVYLLHGRFKKGWRLYNNRLTLPEISIAQRDIPLPYWNGYIRPDTYLFICPEQGIGDEVRFASLYQELIAHNIAAIIECDYRLLPLYKRSFPSLSFLPRHDSKLPKLNWSMLSHQASIGLLAYYLRPDIFSFNARPTKFLHADPDKVKSYRQKLKNENRLLVGISWYTTNDRNAHQRGIKLEEFLPLFKDLPIDTVNLQYNYDEDEVKKATKKNKVICTTVKDINTRNDIDDIAAIIEACDLVVNISNFTAHLSAALGKETWVFLSNSPLWHWMMKRLDNQWYPTVKIYRQNKMLSWEQPLADARADIEAYVSEKLGYHPSKKKQ